MKIEGQGVYVDVHDSLSYFTTPEGMQRLDRFPRGKKVFGPDKDQVITNVLAGKKGDLLSLSLKNGNSISIGLDTLVFTATGWKKVQELTSEDYVFQGSVRPRYFNNAGAVIPYKNQNQKGSLPIYIPQKLSFSFCQWMGMYLAKGFINQKKIEILGDDSAFVEKYLSLTKEIFTITPEINEDKRGGRKPTYFFRSQNVISFIQSFFGQGVFQKIPAFLLESSLEEQVEFLKGLQYQAKINRDQELVFLKTKSKLVATFVSSVFSNCGYVSLVSEVKKQSRFKKDVNDNVHTQDYTSYEVKVLGLGQENFKIELDNQELNKILNSPAKCLVLFEDFENHQPREFHPNISAWRSLKKKDLKLLKLNIVRSLHPDYVFEGYFSKVKSLKKKEQVNLINLKLLSPKGLYINSFLIGGI